ncbi:hypothetical protein QQP08_017831 [Theobroma cacao]|nr:hypothetical protein QQP08_017831 [Theobroma cacao]
MLKVHDLAFSLPCSLCWKSSYHSNRHLCHHSCFKFADAKLLTPEFLESIDPHSSTIVASNTVRSWLTWTALQNLSLAYITLCAKLPLLGLEKLSNFAAFNNLDLATTAAITEYFSLV